MLSRPFRAGEPVVYRDMDDRRRIRSVIAARVVRDDATGVVLWLPIGAPSIKPTLVRHTPGTPRRWEDGNWFLERSTWRWAELLVIAAPDEMRATWVRWSAERVFQGWAVNMQSPLVRTSLGFDHCDHQLDILVDPDRTWRWKDEHELAFAVERGIMTPEQVETVRLEGARAVLDIEANAPPFGAGWERWIPDPSWSIPELPESWPDVSMYRAST